MSKWQVKCGEEFDLEVKVGSEDDSKAGSLKNWKSLAVVAVFITVMSAGGYAAVTHDFTLYDKLLQAMVEIAKASAEGTGKSDAGKTECQGKNH
ncbi:hypothetical protein [Burkholderia stagnalis]|uniref:hypothetical protein n=1 Tax=Burkholderia stagnalis TaxID=1503054 RepID=UPI000B024DB3|nr:hypothetical protein [Burkholderia stagnalis]